MDEDRLIFSKYDFMGHTIFTHEKDTTYNQIRILIPVGNVHAHDSNPFCINGLFHFLEHMSFEKSRNWNNKVQYEEFLASTGTHQNATTGPFFTEFNFKAPTQHFTNALPEYFDHVTYPIYDVKDIELQAKIIKNERSQCKYFPGSNQLSQYLMTKWINATYYPIDQLYGSDTNLEEISETQLKQAHEAYYRQPLTLFVGGPHIQEIQNEIEMLLLPAKPVNNMVRKKVPVHWVNKEYHEFINPDVSTRVFYFGGFQSTSSVEEYWGLEFLINILTDPEFGVLTSWMRKNNGWTYGIESDIYIDKETILWWVGIPLNNEAPLPIIRNELDYRITESCKDSNIIKQAKQRIELELSFSFETLDTRIDRAVHLYSTFGVVPSEKQYLDWLRIQNSKKLLEIYNKYISPESLGQCCALPVS